MDEIEKIKVRLAELEAKLNGIEKALSKELEAFDSQKSDIKIWREYFFE